MQPGKKKICTRNFKKMNIASRNDVMPQGVELLMAGHFKDGYRARTEKGP